MLMENHEALWNTQAESAMQHSQKYPSDLQLFLKPHWMSHSALESDLRTRENVIWIVFWCVSSRTEEIEAPERPTWFI